ncbi:hypothetical protein JXA88_18750 [Candidatus Fermentibacteria bacterium]|nr:hypothetical protein [Candidatus Fermentibacteria bacterium]
MRVIKTILLHLVFVVIFLLVIDRLAASLLLERALSTPVLTNDGSRTIASWPLRSDPATGWALAPPPDAASKMAEGFRLSGTGIGLRWLPGLMDMGPPLVLLVFGDETALGASVSLPETFGGVVKYAAEERLPDRTVAVANAAVPGYDAIQMCLQFKRLTAIRPHLAVFCFSLGGTLSPTVPVSRPIHLRSGLVKELLYRPGLTQALYLGIDRLKGGTEVSGIRWGITAERIRDADVVEFDRALAQIIHHADRARVPLLMTSLVLPEVYRSALEQHCLAAGVAYVDGDVALVEHAQETSSKRPSARADSPAPDSSLAAPTTMANDTHAWWIQRYLRPRLSPVFMNRTYFTPHLQPNRMAHRVLGEALSLAIAEGDLFSWRHRVLK